MTGQDRSFRRALYGPDDVLIAGATAVISFQGLPDLGFIRIRCLLEQVDGPHHHARRAETALQGMLILKSLLNRMQCRAIRHALNGRNPRALGLLGEQGAGFNRAIVHMDRAGAALGGVTPHMRAGQAQLIPQGLDKDFIVTGRHPKGPAIHFKTDGGGRYTLQIRQVGRCRIARQKVSPDFEGLAAGRAPGPDRRDSCHRTGSGVLFPRTG